MKRVKLSIFISLMMASLFVNAQNSEVSIRFSNPNFDCDAKTYCLDVEYNSDSSADTLYGTNVRFFYNSAQLDLVDFRSLATDYGVSRVPTTAEGVASSGADLFNFPSGEAAVWVNGAIELQNTANGGRAISQSGWTKFFEVCFDVVGDPTGIEDFCPEVIWDLEQDRTDGGFLPGNDGVVITLKNGSFSKVSDESVVSFNWEHSGNGSAPYGDYSQSSGGCLTETCIVCNVPSTMPPVKQP